MTGDEHGLVPWFPYAESTHEAKTVACERRVSDSTTWRSFPYTALSKPVVEISHSSKFHELTSQCQRRAGMWTGSGGPTGAGGRVWPSSPGLRGCGEPPGQDAPLGPGGLLTPRRLPPVRSATRPSPPVPGPAGRSLWASRARCPFLPLRRHPPPGTFLQMQVTCVGEDAPVRNLRVTGSPGIHT